MPLFLSISGVEPPLLARDYKRTLKEVGERGTAEDGTPYASIRRRKWLHEMRIGPVSQADAKAWTGLIQGEGHYFPWDADLYSAQGLGPNAGHDGTLETTTKKFGAGSLKVVHASHLGDIQYPAALGSEWTVLTWHYESAAWNFWVIRSDTKKWKNGVQQADGLPAWMAVVSGTLYLYADGVNTAGYFDDLVAFPFKVPDDWPVSWWIPAVWPVAQPAVELRGAFLRTTSDPVNALGRVVETELQRIMLAGSWTVVAEILRVELEEL